MISIKRHYCLIFSHFLLALMAVNTLRAANLGVPADFATIQAAIDASASGDTIIISAGTYSGEGNYNLNTSNKTITIEGENANTTIIDCQGSESQPKRGFIFDSGESAGTIIKNLTIKNGWSTLSGGAISFTNSSSPTIENCIFTSNTANFYGGAFYCLDNSSPTINDCTFNNNRTVQTIDAKGGLDGGAIYCINTSSPAITGCIFDNNSAKSGGAIYSNGSSPVITECTFTSNTAVTRMGGAASLWACQTTIKNCLFANNYANFYGGAIRIESGSTASITNCTLSNNSTGIETGGGISINGSTTNPTIKNCIIWNNLPDEINILSGSASISYCNIKGGSNGTNISNKDPLFADEDNGDYHLKSTIGRWIASSSSWTIDSVTSPCIDGGDGESAFDDEPTPNGSKINLGAYGNTAQASKSPGTAILTAVVDGGNGSVDSSGEYLIGTQVTLKATPDDGYRVLSWSGTDNDPNEGSNTNTVTMSEDKTVTVIFDRAPVTTFTLSASVIGDGGTISPQSGTFDNNTIVTLTASPSSGYRIKTWSGTNNDESTSATNTVTMDENKTVSVEFEEVIYTLTANVTSEHGEISPAGESEHRADSVIELTATPDEGYVIKEWNGTDDDTSIDTTNSITLDGDKTVSVTFEPIMYTFSVSVDGEHGTVSSDISDDSVAYDTLITLSASPEEGYRVAGWSGTANDPNIGSNTNYVVIKGDTHVSVQFEEAPATSYTFNAQVINGNGTIEPISAIYSPFDVIRLIASPFEGYRVKKWSGTNDDTSTEEVNFVTMLHDTEITVEFERVYELTASVIGEHGTVSPTTNLYVSGEVVTLTAVPDEGYRVKEWKDADDAENIEPSVGSNSINVTITDDINITVEFEELPEAAATLTTAVIGGNGVVNPSSGHFDPNTTISLVAIPDETYEVKAWIGTDDDDSTSETNSIVMTGDKSVSVEFKMIEYALSTIAVGPGSVSGEDNYFINTLLTIVATPDEGCRVASWSGTEDDKSTETTNIVRMDSDKTVTVTFEAITYELTLETILDSDDVAHGSLVSDPDDDTFDSGEVVELIATPDAGYRVKEWIGADTSPAAGSNTNQVTMSEDKSVSVEFELLPSNVVTLSTEIPTGHGSVIPASGTYNIDEVVTLMAVPDEGYEIKSWNDASSTSSTFDVTMDENKTVVLRFQKIINYYDLTASVIGEHGVISPTTGTYEEGKVVSLVATPENGYRVKEWIGADITPFTGGNENHVTMTEDKEVSVEFEELPTQTYTTLSVNIQGQGKVSPASGSYSSGQVVSLSASPEPGHHLVSWLNSDDDESTQLTNTVTMDTNKTVTVTFEPDAIETYTLSVNVPNGGGTVVPNSGECTPGSVVTLTATPESGYQLASWLGTDNDPNVGGLTNNVTMNADKTVTVEFEEIPIVPLQLTTIVINGHGQISPASGLFNQNSLVTLTAIPESGYEVKAWTGTNNDESTEPTNHVTMTAAKTVSVEFQLIKYSLTIVIIGPGSLGGQGNYEANDEVSLTAIPDANCIVTSWLGTDNDASAELTNSVTMSRDKTVTITFEPIRYELTLSTIPDDGEIAHGSLISNPASGPFESGEVVDLIASPDTGYRVKEWTGTNNDPAAGSNTNQITITQASTVSVEFEALPTQTFTLTTQIPTGNGQVSPSSGTYNEGQVVTLTATPNAGYKIKSWNGVLSTSNTYDVTMTSDKNVIVEFEEIASQTLNTLQVNVVGQGSVSPQSGSYYPGSTITLIATPSDGYCVGNWSGTDDDSSKSNTNAVTLNSDKTVTLTFAATTSNPNTYELTLTTIPDDGEIVHGSLTSDPEHEPFTSGQIVTLIATPDENYRVKEWRGTNNDPSTGSNTNQVTMTENKTVSVEFESLPITQYFELTTNVTAGQGQVIPSSGIYNAGESVTLTAIPDEGYKIKSWNGQASTNETFTLTMDSDKIVNVEFELIPPTAFTLTTDVPTGHGSISPSNGSFAPGTTLTLTATPDPGYEVTAWNGVASAQTTLHITMTGNKDISVEFELIDIGLETNACGSGIAIFVPLCFLFALMMKLNFVAFKK